MKEGYSLQVYSRSTQIQRACPEEGKFIHPWGQQDIQFQQDTNPTALIAESYHPLTYKPKA